MKAYLACAAALVALPAASALADTLTERGEKKLARLLGDRIAGQPVRCFTTHSGTEAFFIEGVALVYDNGPVIYVGRPTGTIDPRDTIVRSGRRSEPGRDRDDVCATDRFYTYSRRSGLNTGVAEIREFVPYSRG